MNDNEENKPHVGDKRKSPEHIEHLKKVGFQKGRQKTGGRVPLPKELKEAIAEKSPEALEVMYDLMYNSTNESVRFKAAEWIMSTMVSKAPSEQKIEVNHTHQIADMMARINAQRHGIKDITPATPVIEANFVPLEIEDEGEV